jgi:carbon starvation protein CstA
MDNIFLIATLITFIFLIIKFLEMRYIDKENKPIKTFIKDGLTIYVSVIIGYYIIGQLIPVVDKVTNISQPVAFTDNPPF